MNRLRDLLDRSAARSAPELERPLGDGRIQCLACAHRCKIPEGRRGVCRVRFVREGTLLRPAGYVAGAACDPIEKKPFFHAYPGCDALTFGMLGCNLHCPYCQNWITSQALRDEEASAPPRQADPEGLVRAAVDNGARAVISSYNEPLITADWAVEVFRAARAQGLACGFVSNGNATPEVLEYLRPLVDLFKVDLKGFREDSYRRLGGRLANVLDTIRRLKGMGFWVEVVTLVVPGFNDSEEELRDMAEFLAGVDPSIPWHLTAFHPDYRMDDGDRTPAAALLGARRIARAAGLRYVYVGNIAAGDAESTRCHSCGALLIRRSGFRVEENRMRGAVCPDCGERIPGVWEESPSRGGQGFPRPISI
jgi:pyruvate formate lyase activating enzyme